MADYKELLRRAISALPENNGAARRAVYEKARSALVGQLRAITPPLPARDITQHRLQLEDCIRQVEQEASEAVISLGRETSLGSRSVTPAASPAPVVQEPAPVVHEPERVDEPSEPDEASEPAKPAKADEPADADVNADESASAAEFAQTDEPAEIAEAPERAVGGSIEDIINQAAAAGATSVEPVVPVLPQPTAPAKDEHSAPMIVARAEAAKNGPFSTISGAAAGKSGGESPLKTSSFTARHESAPMAANSPGEPMRVSARVEPSLGNHALARKQTIAPPALAEEVGVEAALSAIREVDVEPGPREAEGAISRAIETLDREARGEAGTPPADADSQGTSPDNADTKRNEGNDAPFAASPSNARSGTGLTIFLVVFVLLLAGVGGGGYWAWREGYVDLDQMFGRAGPASDVTPVPPASDAEIPRLDAADSTPPTSVPTSGPGNTATLIGPDEPTTALQGLEVPDRLEPTLPAIPDASQSELPQLGGEDTVKGEERLPDAADQTTDLATSVDPAVLAGSQSLLLEASTDGRTGAVPFSGTIEWSEGVDETGLPTLIGKANIPARNLGVNLTIRKNSDPSLPASHLMEIDFKVNDTFVGGTIASLPGVLLKDQELVPGTPLVGASARVVGNSFLFALSATAADAATNTDLLENRKWMDLAVIYGTGRNAIITLEKDDAAQALFDKVFAAWAKPAN